jgi:hypothetical protein
MCKICSQLDLNPTIGIVGHFESPRALSTPHSAVLLLSKSQHQTIELACTITGQTPVQFVSTRLEMRPHDGHPSQRVTSSAEIVRRYAVACIESTVMAAQQVDTTRTTSHSAEMLCHVMSEGGRTADVPWYGMWLAVEKAYRIPNTESKIYAVSACCSNSISTHPM